METQCPHCQKKYKAPEDSKGKKVRCPKCGQSFVVTPLQVYPQRETCDRCGSLIGQSQQACVYAGRIVCADCDHQLRSGAENAATVVSSHKETPLRAEDGIRSESIPCFFCQGTSDKASAYTVTLCQVLRAYPVAAAGIKKTILSFGGGLPALILGNPNWALFRRHEVKVPRCRRCKQQHDVFVHREDNAVTRAKWIGWGGALLGTIGGIFIAAKCSVQDPRAHPVLVYLLAPLFGLVGWICGMMVGLLAMFGLLKITEPRLPEGIKPTKVARDYPKVQEMIADNWQEGKTPSKPSENSFYLLNEDVETKLGVRDAMTAEEVMQALESNPDVPTGVLAFDRRRRSAN